MPPLVIPPTAVPGAGDVWLRLADAVRTAIPPGEIDGIWTFRVIRRDGRDWGKVLAFHDFGAGRTMEVSGGEASRSPVMLPFTDEAVPEIDVPGGKVLVDPPAGVLPGGSEKEA